MSSEVDYVTGTTLVCLISTQYEGCTSAPLSPFLTEWLPSVGAGRVGVQEQRGPWFCSCTGRLSLLAGMERRSGRVWGQGHNTALLPGSPRMLQSNTPHFLTRRWAGLVFSELAWDLGLMGWGWTGGCFATSLGSDSCRSTCEPGGFTDLLSAITCSNCSSDLSLQLILNCILCGELKNKIIFQEFSLCKASVRRFNYAQVFALSDKLLECFKNIFI